MPTPHHPRPLRGLAAGIAAGLAASLAMNLFQRAWTRVSPLPEGDDPATVKAAQKTRRAATGKYFAREDKEAAGNAVHYLFGAGLGAAYGLIAEYRPEVTKGFGTLFGAASAALDEVGVPAAGLSGPPTNFPAATHAYALASHVVFGGATEAGRRLLRGKA
ncbi:MAG: DUF1440 domain-containing protein [Sphingomicrobium sp.]